MRIQRTIPPSAVPLSFLDLGRGLCAVFDREAVATLEDEIKGYFGAQYVFLLSSGKAALALTLMAMKGLSKRRKVIIPAYTCYSVPSAVALAGLDIVPCDLNPETLDYDFAELERSADEDTLCIVSTHLFGIASDVRRIRDLGRKHGIYVIEDAAQAMGATRGSEKLGTIGDAGFFSLGRGKNITCGSGGIIVTSSDEIGRGLTELYLKLGGEPPLEYARNMMETVLMKIFSTPSLYWFPYGLPFLKIGDTRFYTTFPLYKLSRFKAGLLHRWKDKLEKTNSTRLMAGRFYLSRLTPNHPIRSHADDCYYLRFPLYMNSAARKKEICSAYRFLGISPMYPDSINKIAEIRGRFGERQYKNAETIAKTLIALPTHGQATEHDKARICEAVTDFLSDNETGATSEYAGNCSGGTPFASAKEKSCRS